MSYEPENVPHRLESVPEWLLRELYRISNEFKVGLLKQVEFLNAAPTRLENGMIRGADGTNWNPGAGRGLYWYDSVSSAWKVISAAVARTWQALGGSRALGTPYLNNTGRPIIVYALATSTATTALRITTGSGIFVESGLAVTPQAMAVYLEVPDGETYTATVGAGTGTLLVWNELR